VSEHDLVALQRFAAEAATILTEQESDRATTLQAEWDRALAHACRGGLVSVVSQAENIRLKIGGGGGHLLVRDADIADNVQAIKQVTDELIRIVIQIYNVVNPGEDSKEASLREVLQSAAWRFERHRVKYQAWPDVSRDNDAPSDIKVALNRDILKWVIDELARNACRALETWKSPYDPFDYFSQPDPEVRVQVFLGAPIPRTLDRYQQYALLLFGDNGKGIEWEFQDKVFLPGKAGNSSREQGGTGFGLSLVRKTIEAHRGLIGFNSAPGSGCTFYLYLPLAKCGVAAASPPDPEASP
jgi:signal transduction histidine kinase